MKKSNSKSSSAEMSHQDTPLQSLDLFLNENTLIALAMRELRGAPPPDLSEPPPWATARAQQSSQRHKSKTLLARELDARGWTARELAEASGLSYSEAQALAKGNIRISAETAHILARVFATSPEFWLGAGE